MGPRGVSFTRVRSSASQPGNQRFLDEDSEKGFGELSGVKTGKTKTG